MEKYQKLIKILKEKLGIEITPLKGYAVDPNKYNGTPFPIYKDIKELNAEKEEIMLMIDDLYLTSEIDTVTSRKLKQIVQSTYQKYINERKNNDKPNLTPEEIFFQELKTRYNYNNMSPQEKIDFTNKYEEILFEYELNKKISDITIEEFFRNNLEQQELESDQLEHTSRRIK